MTKAETLAACARGEGCLGCSHDDEPVFVLRANDPVAAETVADWARRYQAHKAARGEFDGRARAKRDEAVALAASMDAWRETAVGRPPAAIPVPAAAHAPITAEQSAPARKARGKRRPRA